MGNYMYIHEHVVQTEFKVGSFLQKVTGLARVVSMI